MEKRLVIPVTDDLHRKVKVAAAQAGLSITDLVRRLLELWLQGEVEVRLEE